MTCPAHDSQPSPILGPTPQPPGSPKTKGGASTPNRPVDRRAFFRQLLAKSVGELEQRTRDITSRVQQAVQQAQTSNQKQRIAERRTTDLPSSAPDAQLSQPQPSQPPASLPPPGTTPRRTS